MDGEDAGSVGSPFWEEMRGQQRMSGSRERKSEAEEEHVK